MEKTREMFKNISMPDFPGKLHGRIIKNIVLAKFKIYFAVIAGFLIFNLLLVSWHIWTKIIDAEAYSLISALFYDFELSYNFISDFTGMVFEAVPVSLVAIFVVNVLMIAYAFRFRLSLEKDSIPENA